MLATLDFPICPPVNSNITAERKLFLLVIKKEMENRTLYSKYFSNHMIANSIMTRHNLMRTQDHMQN